MADSPASIYDSSPPSLTPSQSESTCRVICRVCQKQFSQYTCPRCNTRYCSLPCYKSHSLSCTESFMRENVVDELRQLRPDDKSKRRMLEILKRFHAENEDDDSMDEDGPRLSEETIQKVLSGDNINYDDLTAEEKKLFHQAMTSGELSKMIEPWEPWWLNPSVQTLTLGQGGARLVQPIPNKEASISEQGYEVGEEASEIPAGPDTPLPPLTTLTSAEPSPLLAIHLVDILYSYCFTLRLYNGDCHSDVVGAAMAVLSVSSVLGQAAQPESMLEAVSNCLEQTCSPAFRHMGGMLFGFGLLDDVMGLLSLGRAALVCALCDLQRLVQSAQRELKSEKPGRRKSVEIRGKLKCADRKIYFIMCWVNEQPQEVWSSLEVLVKAEKASALEYRANKRTLTTDKTNGKNKGLIEEV